MLIAGSRLIDAPVMGLQTGSELARIKRAVVDPRTLEIVAYEVDGPLLNLRPSLLRVVDVREFSDIGLIVDSSDEFVAPNDVIKLNEVYTLNFIPVGMRVIDEKRQKLGKVIDYTIETTSFIIQQLVVRRPWLQGFSDPELLVHRTQITAINNIEIVVHARAKTPQPTTHATRTVYDNPFRKHPQPEHADTHQN